MKIELIGFDADDTLWHTETYYTQAQQQFQELLSPWAPVDKVDEVTNQVILNNLPVYGYGINSLILSLTEAAIYLSAGEIRGDQIEQLLLIGKSMKSADVVLRPHVIETLQNLSASYQLMIITKGDLLDQTTKIKQSGVAAFFSMVEIVNDKTPETYTAILEKYRIDPKHFVMVGNTIRSDVHPVLAVGGIAVHIPADSTWDHEIIPGFNEQQPGYHHLDHIGQLPDLITRIDNAF